MSYELGWDQRNYEFGWDQRNMIVTALIVDGRNIVRGFACKALADLELCLMKEYKPYNIECIKKKQGSNFILGCADMLCSLSQLNFNGSCYSSSGREFEMDYDTSSFCYRGPRGGKVKIDDLPRKGIKTAPLDVQKYLMDNYKPYLEFSKEVKVVLSSLRRH